MKGKKAQKLLFSYIIAFLVIGMFVVTFITVPSLDGGFFKMQGYSQNDTSEITALDNSQEYSQKVQEIICDINSESDSCSGQTQTSLQAGTDTIDENILQGGFRVIVTLTKSLGITENLIIGIGGILGIPEDMTNIIVAMFFGVLMLTLFLIIFNRSAD